MFGLSTHGKEGPSRCEPYWVSLTIETLLKIIFLHASNLNRTQLKIVLKQMSFPVASKKVFDPLCHDFKIFLFYVYLA